MRQHGCCLLVLVLLLSLVTVPVERPPGEYPMARVVWRAEVPGALRRMESIAAEEVPAPVPAGRIGRLITASYAKVVILMALLLK